MGKFETALPYVITKEFEELYRFSPEMYGEVVKAGGEVAYETVKANAPASFKKSNIMKKLKMTKVYKTPSDGAINVKIGFYGYFINHNKKVTPAPLVANVFEYGSFKFPKRPFFRRSMRNRQIIVAMMNKEQELVKKHIKSWN